MRDSSPIMKHEMHTEFDLEEYMNGGYDDETKLRSYRFGTYYQRSTRYT